MERDALNSANLTAKYSRDFDWKKALKEGPTLIVCILPIIVLVLSIFAHLYERFPGDLDIAQWVQSISLPLFEEAMRAVSVLGEWTWGITIASVSFFLLLLLRKRNEALILAGMLVLASVLFNPLAKALIDRPRPRSELLNVIGEADAASFPSGHVVFAAAFFGLLLTYTFLTAMPQPFARWTIRIVLMGLILSMGFSRVYLGVHWPSDVVGGYLFGGFFVCAGAWVYIRVAKRTTGYRR